MPTTATIPAPVRARFKELVARWKLESLFLSSTTAMTELASYQEIIRMGEPAVPLLLAELEREPNHWFMALMAITGAAPVRGEDRGRLDRMTVAWLGWGRATGYLC